MHRRLSLAAKYLFIGMLAGSAVLTGATGQGGAQTLLPDRRSVYTLDTDLPGGDLRSIFDTTLEACETACRATPSCTAFTFNARNGSCFPKATPGTPTPYGGAISARLIETMPEAVRLAQERRAPVRFLRAFDLERAAEQASGLGRQHAANDRDAEALRSAAALALAGQDFGRARDLVGAATTLGDLSGDWRDYARLSLLLAIGDRRRTEAQTALLAAVNAYLRAESEDDQHDALRVLADSAEMLGRGRDGLAALRLAQTISPRPETASSIERFAGLYGFRVEMHEVQSDLASPRVCAFFTEDLAEAGVDFAPFVQLPTADLTVERDSSRQLCVGGLAHGSRSRIVLRAGLPAADGQRLARDVPIDVYIRDRQPVVRFSGRGYVLPAGASAALPVETVNASQLDLTLYRVSDRNLIASIRGNNFARQMESWQGEQFTERFAGEVWRGEAVVPSEINRDMTARLQLDEALAGQGAGIYLLRAALPGPETEAASPGWQWFVVSDIGISTFQGTDGLWVVLRGLSDAAPRAGVEVELVSAANDVLAEAVSDADGIVRFGPEIAGQRGAGRPALVVARSAETDLAFLSLSEPEFDLSDRGVEGRAAAPPIDVFMTTDRGAYRAGETIHLTVLARDGAARALPGLPLTARLRRPDGVEYSRALLPEAGAGGHVGALPLAASAPRGTWRLEVLADPDAAPLASRSVLVEDFLPERIDFAVVPEADAVARPGETLAVRVEARYLFGAPAADLSIDGETILRPAAGLSAFPGYRFGRADLSREPEFAPLPVARTDAEGRARVAALLPELRDQSRPMEAEIRMRIAEGSNRPVERSLTLPLAPEGRLIGLRPGFEDVVEEGGSAAFELLVLDDGTPAQAELAWRLERLNTRYQWYQLYGSWSWEPVTTRSRVADGRISSSADGAPVRLAPAVEWGEYELTVEAAPDAAGVAVASSVRFAAGWYAIADTAQTPDMLEVSLDKQTYAAGETAVLRIVPRSGGTALVTVLSNRVIAMQTIAVEPGENRIELPVTDEWGSGVYVTATVLRPTDGTASRVPTRALGLAHAAVDPGTRRLAARLIVPAEAEPRSDLRARLAVEGFPQGAQAHATIAAVDLGILNLTSFTAPDPAGHYFGQRRLGVALRDLYGRLIDGHSGVAATVRSGGDAGQARLDAPPPTEELVALFSGPLLIGPDGTAQADFAIPSFNGTVRLMAVVWSDTAVGQAEADVLVRDPVVVTASLPRFLAPGDESRLLLEFTHSSGPEGRFGLALDASGASLGPIPESFDLAVGQTHRLAVPLQAGTGGLAKIEVRVTLPDGRVLEKPLRLPVQSGDAEAARTSRFTLEPGARFTLDGEALVGLRGERARATMAAGAFGRLDVPGLVAALDAYPYGCAEQITSRALPLLVHAPMARALGLAEADALGPRIDAAIRDLLTLQGSGGGFGLWRGVSAGDGWLDAYVTDFLARARAAGHAVPQAAFTAALDNLRTQVSYAGDFESGGRELAYALLVLAREGAASIGDLRYYADIKADDFDSPLALAQLGAALAAYGDQPRADALFARAERMALQPVVARTAPDRGWRSDYGTLLRDRAGLLALASEARSAAVDREALAEEIWRSRAGLSALSTQEMAWILLAAQGLADSGEAVAIEGAAPGSPAVALYRAGDPAVTLVNRGTRPTEVTLTRIGVPEVPEPAGGEGFGLSRRYFSLDGAPIDATRVPVGTRMVAVLEITPFADSEGRLMLADPLPAGFEIDVPSLIASGRVEGLASLRLAEWAEHTEFRQDRFLAAIDLRGTAPVRVGYILRAVSPGSFHHPAASVEDMYRPALRGWTDAGRVTVTE